MANTLHTQQIQQQIALIAEYENTGHKIGYQCPRCLKSQMYVALTSHGRGVWFICGSCQYGFHADRSQASEVNLG